MRVSEAERLVREHASTARDRRRARVVSGFESDQEALEKDEPASTIDRRWRSGFPLGSRRRSDQDREIGFRLIPIVSRKGLGERSRSGGSEIVDAEIEYQATGRVRRFPVRGAAGGFDGALARGEGQGTDHLQSRRRDPELGREHGR